MPSLLQSSLLHILNKSQKDCFVPSFLFCESKAYVLLFKYKDFISNIPAFLPVLKRGLTFLYFFCMFLLPFCFEGNNKILIFFGKESLNMCLSVHKQIPLFCNHTMETKYSLPFISRLSAKSHITWGPGY